ncbi:hypothetical protein N7530_001944 [Penicillium desertorum]|uniref:Uncharacterized protein n=1 Tax=Penicillium desertorum TaxID=1303715 RepID=A0A9W9XAX9_9EURO|nr:hypothetical protein N7530_001944 [Penicillium desertorum]
MSSPESLTRPEGTTITLNQSPESPLNVVDVGPSRWAIVSKLQERTNILGQRDVNNGLGPAYVTEKFLCYPIGSSNTLAFMRVYKQVPIAGTEFKKASIRATQSSPMSLQSSPPSSPSKRKAAMLFLGSLDISVTNKTKTIPSLFWGYSFSEREEIRLKFREVYKKVKACGYCLCPGIKKIIYHRPTQMIYLSGFSSPFRTEDTQWSDRIYCSCSLVRPPTPMDQFFPITSVDLKYDDKGWRW